MNVPRSRAWWCLSGLVPALLGAALLAAACVPAAPATPAQAPAQAPTQVAAATSAPATTAPTTSAPATVAAAASPVTKTVDLPSGVDSAGNFYQGDPKASVKLIEYSDFQCPYCGRHATQTGPLLDKDYVASGKVYHVFRNFPLDFHPNAMPAAKAAFCAGQQKPAFFWTMHDWLFANQDKWSSAQDAAAQFRQQAVTVGVDGAKYDACVAASETTSAIQKDIQQGTKDGVQGTPAFFVNDWFLNGAQPYEEFQKAIDKAAQGQHPAPTATPLPAGVQFYDVNPSRPGFTYNGDPTLGSDKAPLVLVSLEDFQCTYCGQYTQTTEPELIKKYVDTNQLRLIYMFLPIEAPKAALASLCAADQGKFWPFHDALFAHQKEWKDGDDEAMVKYAKDLGLDEAKFRQCLKDAPGQATLDADTQMAQGVQGTPFFLLINTKLQSGMRIPGAVPLEQFEQAIQQVLNPSTPTPEAPAAGTAAPAAGTSAPTSGATAVPAATTPTPAAATTPTPAS